MAAQKELTGKKVNTPLEAYRFIEKLPLDQVAYIARGVQQFGGVSKIKAYLNKWRPIRSALPAVGNELAAIGHAARRKSLTRSWIRCSRMQSTGRGKTPEEREKTLRKLSGIKEQPKKKERKEKKTREDGARG